MKVTLHNADCFEILLDMPDNSVDAVVTDPPYGLGKQPDIVAVMQDWVKQGYHEISGSGFMGKQWDAFVPQPNFWKEVIRVMKPGAHCLAFFGSRTYDIGVIAMRFAGFEIRNEIIWLYASGFPKSLNIGKAVNRILGNEREIKINTLAERTTASDKITQIKYTTHKIGEPICTSEPISDEAKQWEGWGTDLKPAHENIVMARKPLSEKNVALNVLKWGCGGINIDASRIGTDIKNDPNYKNPTKSNGLNSIFGIGNVNYGRGCKGKGRFPANVILSHHPECVCVGEKWDCHPDCPMKLFPETKGRTAKFKSTINKGGWKQSSLKKNQFSIGDSGSAARFFKQIDLDDEQIKSRFPANLIHDGSPEVMKLFPESKSTGGKTKGYGGKNTAGIKLGNELGANAGGLGDSGSAARFFYCAKASPSERNQGCDGIEAKEVRDRNTFKSSEWNIDPRSPEGGYKVNHNTKHHNNHPTVKPLKLMKFLVRLVSPPGSTVLDPFMGSGTTGIACVNLNRNFIGIEREPDYFEIAKKRIESAENETPVEMNIIAQEKEYKSEIKPKQSQMSLFETLPN